MSEEKRIRRFYWILAALVLVSVLITWLILALTRPVLSGSSIRIWSVTQAPVEYRDKLNINTATVDEIAYAEDIGPATAQKIYDFLKQNGPISSMDDLDEIPGIGEKRLEELKKIFYAG